MFDISGTTPAITITNTSVGTGLANCTWWYIITDPSGTKIHEGSSGVPDKTGTWATIAVPDTWPQPMGQINYSGSPYKVELYVKDSEGNIYSDVIEQEICHPTGHDASVAGNFGKVSVYTRMDCNKAKLYVEDKTNYSYKGVTGSSVSKSIILDYPIDDTGTRPDPFELENFNNAIIDIPYSGRNFVLYVNSIMNHVFSNGATVRVKYKLTKSLDILCNIDLCPLICSYQKLLDEVENGTCANGNVKEQREKLTIINGLMAQALIAKMQPDCGIDLEATVEKIKEIGGFTCNCYTTGNNGSLIGSDLNIDIDVCGNIVASAVVNGSNIAFTFKVNDVIVALDQTMLDAGFEVAEVINNDTCTKTYTISLTKSLGNCPDVGPIYEHDTSDPPADCPDDIYGTNGVDVWSIDDDEVIGVAHNAAELAAILNANSEYRARGIAIPAGNCNVAWLCLTGAVPEVHVSEAEEANPGCIDGHKQFEINLKKYCDDTVDVITPNYPGRVYVQYSGGGTKYDLGLVTDEADLLSKLAAEPNKPANQTYLAGSTNTKIIVDIYKVECDQVNTTTLLYDRDELVVYGANHHSLVPNVGGVYGMEMNTATQMGKICHPVSIAANYPWHLVRRGNFGYTVLSDTGMLYKYDMSDVRNPFVAAQVQLPIAVPMATNPPFSGLPQKGGTFPSHWDVYFVTDINSQNYGSLLFIHESTSGCFYVYDTATDSVLTYFFVNELIGKCPRCIYEDTLYFTHDGYQELTTSQSSGVARRDMVLLDLNTYNISVINNVAPASDEPWAMSVDTQDPGIAYISTVLGAVVKFDMSSNSIVSTNVDAFDVASGGGWASYLNTVIYNGRLFATALGKASRLIDLVDIGTPGNDVSFENLLAPSGGGTVLNENHYNFLPLPGYCYGLLTYDNNANPGGIAKYDYDGNFLGLASIAAGDIYNVLAFDGNPSGFPNSLC